MSPALQRLAYFEDAVGATSVAYFSIWFYEIGNWISLTLTGSNASLLWSGFFPAGVIGISPRSTGFLDAKLLQVGMCVAVTLAAGIAVRRKGFPLTSVTLAGVTGMYIASVYWEMLSLTSFMPLIIHEVIYGVFSIAATFGLMKVFTTISFRERSKQEL